MSDMLLAQVQNMLRNRIQSLLNIDVGLISWYQCFSNYKINNSKKPTKLVDVYQTYDNFYHFINYIIKTEKKPLLFNISEGATILLIILIQDLEIEKRVFWQLYNKSRKYSISVIPWRGGQSILCGGRGELGFLLQIYLFQCITNLGSKRGLGWGGMKSLPLR